MYLICHFTLFIEQWSFQSQVWPTPQAQNLQEALYYISIGLFIEEVIYNVGCINKEK